MAVAVHQRRWALTVRKAHRAVARAFEPGVGVPALDVRPVPLEGHGHLPQVLRHEGLLEGADVQWRPDVRVAELLHVGELGHHVREVAWAGHEIRDDRHLGCGAGRGVAVWSGVEWLGEEVGVEAGVECESGRGHGRGFRGLGHGSLFGYMLRWLVVSVLGSFALAAGVSVFVGFVEDDFGNAFELGADAEHALDAMCFFVDAEDGEEIDDLVHEADIRSDSCVLWIL